VGRLAPILALTNELFSLFYYFMLFLPRGKVRRQAAVKAAKILPLVGLARSKQDPINRGLGAQYLYRPPPTGAHQSMDHL
jgi:hypothetical protein